MRRRRLLPGEDSPVIAKDALVRRAYIQLPELCQNSLGGFLGGDRARAPVHACNVDVGLDLPRCASVSSGVRRHKRTNVR